MSTKVKKPKRKVIKYEPPKLTFKEWYEEHFMKVWLMFIAVLFFVMMIGQAMSFNYKTLAYNKVPNLYHLTATMKHNL